MLADLLQAASKLVGAGESIHGVELGVVPVAKLADGSVYLTSLQVLLDPVTLVCKRCTLAEAVDLVLKSEPPPSEQADDGDSETDDFDDDFEDDFED